MWDQQIQNQNQNQMIKFIKDTNDVNTIRILKNIQDVVKIQKKHEDDDARFNDRVDKIVKDILEKINADKKKQEEEDATEKAQKKIDADKKKQEEDHEIFKRITTIIFLCFILIYMFYYNSISKNDYDSVSILNLT